MQKLWNEKRLEILTLGLFFIVVFTSLFFLYNSYMNYVISITSQNATQSLVHQVIMFIAGTILFLSLSIVYFKRNYFFVEKEESTEGLENLFEEIKYSSDAKKIEQFKRMLQEKNHTEIYALISNMILELQESKRLADKANEVKTLFLSNMSHEIRTPITGIVGFTNLLRATKLDNEQKEFISIIEKSSEDLLGLVNNLLDVSKIENGQFTLATKSFNLMSEFENFVNTYALDTLEKEIQFSVWIDPQLRFFELEGDIEKIKQVLTNLISNAIKFTHRGGEVELSIEQKAIEKEKVSIAFMVKDTGIGIEKEQCDEVLKLFSQVDSSDTRSYKGIGLGLTLADNLVKLLGGHLTLESEPQRGTQVSFVLEIKKRQE